jgi:hypothetical protein
VSGKQTAGVTIINNNYPHLSNLKIFHLTAHDTHEKSFSSILKLASAPMHYTRFLKRPTNALLLCINP